MPEAARCEQTNDKTLSILLYLVRCIIIKQKCSFGFVYLILLTTSLDTHTSWNGQLKLLIMVMVVNDDDGGGGDEQGGLCI